MRKDGFWGGAGGKNLSGFGHDGAKLGIFNTAYNQRCPRMSATENWVLYGMQSYMDTGRNLIQYSSARNDCARAGFPAHGQIYWGTNATCGWCYNGLRGIICYSPEPPPAFVGDNTRNEGGDAAGQATFTSLPVAGSTIAAMLAASPVASDWNADSLVAVVRRRTTAVVFSGEAGAGETALGLRNIGLREGKYVLAMNAFETQRFVKVTVGGDRRAPRTTHSRPQRAFP